MTRVRAPYMEWAKSRPKPAIDLAGSNLAPCTLDDLPGARRRSTSPGRAPRATRPSSRRSRSATASRPRASRRPAAARARTSSPAPRSSSRATRSSCERPFYDPIPGRRAARSARRSAGSIGASRTAGSSTRTRSRRRSTPRTRLVLLSNPHNPTGVAAATERLRAIGAARRGRGIPVLVDEVYRDVVLEDRPAHRRHALRRLRVDEQPDEVLRPRVPAVRLGDRVAGRSRIGSGASATSWTSGRRCPSDRLSVLAFRNLDALAERAAAIVRANRAARRCALRGAPGARARLAGRHARFPEAPRRRGRDRFRRAALRRDRHRGRARPLLRRAGPLPHRAGRLAGDRWRRGSRGSGAFLEGYRD